LSRFVAAFDEAEFQYGGGSIDVPDPRDDQITAFRSAAKRIIPPRSLLRAGDIQGANLFFLRSALEKIGGFREDWGAGMTIGGEDIELCTRASLAGYTGATLPDLVVHHHHGRRAAPN
jgi:GT2 family glycosyltransferase